MSSTHVDELIHVIHAHSDLALIIFSEPMIWLVDPREKIWKFVKHFVDGHFAFDMTHQEILLIGFEIADIADNEAPASDGHCYTSRAQQSAIDKADYNGKP